MENMRFVDYLDQFRPGKPIRDVKGWIDALVEHHATLIIREVRKDCGKSVLRLGRYGQTLEECTDNLSSHLEEVIKSYLLDEIRPWLTEFSLSHLDEDTLYIYDYRLDKDGNKEYPIGILPKLNVPEEQDTSVATENSNGKMEEDLSIPDKAEDLDFLMSIKWEDFDLSWDDSWIDSLSEEELLKMGERIGQDIDNPLKDETARKEVMDLLLIIFKKVKDATDYILHQMKWHQFQQPGKSLADYADVIAPVINGKIFEEHLDESTLEAIFKGEPVDGLTLMSSKKTLLVHVMKIMCMDGPAECRVRGWRKRVAKALHLEEAFKKRWYDQPGEESGSVLKDIGDEIKRITGVDKLKYEQDRRK